MYALPTSTVGMCEKYQDGSITDDANDATKLRQALFRAKKRNIRTPYKRTNRFFIGQDLQGFSGYQNKYADIHSKVVYFILMIDLWNIFLNYIT